MRRAVIFDMDGVIVESEYAHIEAERQTFLKHDIRISPKELHKYTGTTARIMLTDLIKKYGIDTTFEEIFREKEEILFKLLKKDLHPTKGIIDLLKELKKENVKLAIASSSHGRLIKHVLAGLDIAHFFESIIGAEDIMHSKPDPEIFLKSAKQLNVDPAECVVVEDAKLGVEAAKKAGMKCIGYRNPNSGNQDLSKADIVISDFSKLRINELLR